MAERKLKIAPTLSLPVELMTLAVAVLGIRSSGKTNTAGVFVEELLDQGQQTVIIDPLDVWYGLKSSEDGKSPGYPIVVLGGEHGDLPIRDVDGTTLADFIVQERIPAILSLRHLSKAAQKRFVADFAEQLYERKGETKHRTPLAVVIDEASTFVPQRFPSGFARMVGAIEDLVRRGRASGIGVVLVDQRAATVNKDVLTQVEMLVMHRTTSPQDQNALDEWIKAHDTAGRREAFMTSLASLAQGEAWFWSPGWLDLFERVKVRKRRTFDSSATPKIGQKAAVPKKLADVDLSKLQEQLSATILEAKAEDPRELRKEIAQLRKEMAELERAKPTAAAAPAKEKPILRAGELKRLETLIDKATNLEKLEKAVAELTAYGQTVTKSAVELSKQLDQVKRGAETHLSQLRDFEAASEIASRQTRLLAPPKRERAVVVESTNRDAERLPPRQQRILDALRELEDLGIPQPVRSVVAVFGDRGPASSSYDKDLGTMRTQGLIDYPTAGSLQLTKEGRSLAAEPRELKTLRDFHEAWFNKLEPRKVKVVKTLINHYPKAIHRDELASWSERGDSSSSYDKDLGAMRTLGILDYPQQGYVRATELLFPPGLN